VHSAICWHLEKSDTEDMIAEHKSGKAPATILIAEDEDLIRMTMVDVLQEEEFLVLEAQDGESALLQLAAKPEISLVITDVGLPGLNGRQLLERARKTHPGLKAIFVTGYSREILHQQAADGGPQDDWVKAIPVLRKPFDLTDLIDKVRSVLEND
jgi:CheY-like chemotaxis protein